MYKIISVIVYLFYIYPYSFINSSICLSKNSYFFTSIHGSDCSSISSILIKNFIFFKYEIFYMYLVLFIIGMILNILLEIRGKKMDIKEIILGTIIFSAVPLIITFGILYLILLNFIY